MEPPHIEEKEEMIEMTADDRLIAPNEPATQSELVLGIDGFTYADLYIPQRLEKLTEVFYDTVAAVDPDLHKEFSDYRQVRGVGYADKTESNLIVKMAPHLSQFLARLFNIEAEREAQRLATASEMDIFDFKKNFIQRRVF